jgi:hypothetical protein
MVYSLGCQQGGDLGTVAERSPFFCGPDERRLADAVDLAQGAEADTALSVIGFVGAIILVGIVVKNAIVLVDYVKLLRERGYDVIDAIVDGSSARLRPVLMTTLTTALAMSPLASTTSPTRTSRRAQIPTRRSPPWSTPMASAA